MGADGVRGGVLSRGSGVTAPEGALQTDPSGSAGMGPVEVRHGAPTELGVGAGVPAMGVCNPGGGGGRGVASLATHTGGFDAQASGAIDPDEVAGRGVVSPIAVRNGGGAVGDLLSGTPSSRAMNSR